jgi:hypothetical protein
MTILHPGAATGEISTPPWLLEDDDVDYLPPAQTPFVAESIGDPGLREAMGAFDAVLPPPAAELSQLRRAVLEAMSRAGRALPDRSSTSVAVIGARSGHRVAYVMLPVTDVNVLAANEDPADDDSPDDGENDAAACVQDLATALAIPVRDVLKIAGIKHRTFYSWADQPGVRPRLASQGRLWELAQAVADLRENLGPNLVMWLHGSPDRLRLLRSGEFDALVSELVREQVQGVEREPVLRSGAVGTEEDLELTAGPRLTVRRGGGTRVSLRGNKPPAAGGGAGGA